MGYSSDICPRCNGTGEIRKPTAIATADSYASFGPGAISEGSTVTINWDKTSFCAHHPSNVWCFECVNKTIVKDKTQSPCPSSGGTKQTDSESEGSDKSSPA